MSLRRQTPSSLNRHTETPDSHTSATDTRTDIYNEAVDAATDGKPVLIPCFGVGRSQEFALYVQKNGFTLPEEDRKQLNVVYDGMAQSATATYNEHCRAEFAAESIRNYIVNSGTNNHSSSIRRRLLTNADVSRGIARS